MKKFGIIIMLIVLTCVGLGANLGAIAFADENTELTVLKTNNLGISSIKVSNIQCFLKKQEKQKKSAESIANEIYKALSYTSEDIDKLSLQELLYILEVESVEIQNYIIEVNAETGEQNLRESAPQELLNKAEITKSMIETNGSNDIIVNPGGSETDIKSNDWMQITSVFYQDSRYNKTREEEVERIDKDGNPYTTIVEVIERYGYKCDFTFKWLSNPLWRSVEELGIAWSDGDGIYISGSDWNVYRNKGSVSYDYSFSAGMEIREGTYFEELPFEINGIYGRSLTWNLPTNLSGIYFYGFTYNLGVILEVSRDFNMIASYAHRTFGMGGLGISIGPASISFSAASKSVFSTGAYLIDVPTI